VEQKTCKNVFWQRLWNLDALKYFQENPCEIFNCVDLCSCAATVLSTTTRAWINDATVVCRFLRSVLYPSKFYYLWGNILRQHFTLYFSRIRTSQSFNDVSVFNGKPIKTDISPLYCYSSTYWRSLYIAVSKEYLINSKIILYRLKPSLHGLYCLTFSLKFVNVSRSELRKQNDNEHSVHSNAIVVNDELWLLTEQCVPCCFW